MRNLKLKTKNKNSSLNIISFAFCTILLCFTFYILDLPIVSAEGVSLKIQPSNLQIRAKTPADVRAPFTITNQSGESVNLSILLKRIRNAGDETGNVVFSTPGIKTESDKDAFLKMVQIVDDGVVVPDLTLGPKQEKKLLLRIQLPKDLLASTEQDYYFSVIFLANPPKDAPAEITTEKETVASIQSGISLPVLVSVNQKKEPVGFLDDFSAPLMLQSGPVPFAVKVENTGEHFVQAEGIILIKNMFGQTVGKIEIPKTNILSDSKRLLSSDSVQKIISADKNSTGNVVWNEPFLLGFYTATLTLTITPDQSLYTRSVYFFAFPIVGSIILFSALLVGVFLIRRVKKKMA